MCSLWRNSVAIRRSAARRMASLSAAKLPSRMVRSACSVSGLWMRLFISVHTDTVRVAPHILVVRSARALDGVLGQRQVVVRLGLRRDKALGVGAAGRQAKRAVA